MANNITIDIDAKDNASGIIGGVFELVRNGATAFDVVATAALASANFVRDATQEAFEYNQQIYGLSLSTDQTTEATSRMVQTLDDAGIGFDTVKRAMKEMAKDGTEPNIQELARLSDEFLSLQSGAERGKFLLDKFGKSGEDMARAMALGGDALLEMNAGINENLIVTQQAIEQSEKYRRNVDDMNDSWQAFKIGLGNDTIPIVNNAFEQLNQNMEESGGIVGVLRFGFDDLFRVFTNQSSATITATGNNASYSDSLRDVAAGTTDLGLATQLTTDEIKEMTAANNSQMSLVKKLQTDSTNYNKTLAEMTAKYGENSDQVKQLKADHEAAMQSIVYDLYLARLQADGFSDAEYQMAIATGQALGIIDPATAKMALALNKAASSAEGLGTDLKSAAAAAELLAGNYYVNVITTYVYDGNPPGPLCFISGTRVLSGNEHKPIESLKVGDFVRSYDTEKGEFTDVSISRVFTRKVSTYLSINGIGVTPEHPFFAYGTWVLAKDLRVGDELLSENGESVTIAEIKTIHEAATVYNIETATEPHNYFAGGVLVHNKTLGETGDTGSPKSPYATNGTGGMIDYDRLAQSIVGALAPVLK
jgi:hypothetical protein